MRWALLRDLCPDKKGRCRRRRPHGDGGRDGAMERWSSRRQPESPEREVRTERSWKRRAGKALLTPCFQNRERINCCCLKPHSLWDFCYDSPGN